jgi:DNA-binding NarL/FixJ family response regulator
MMSPEGIPTPREIAVLKAVVECGTTTKAAKRLNVAQRTVDALIDHLRNKFNHHSITQIVIWAIKKGWLNETEIILEK